MFIVPVLEVQTSLLQQGCMFFWICSFKAVVFTAKYVKALKSKHVMTSEAPAAILTVQLFLDSAGPLLIPDLEQLSTLYRTRSQLKISTVWEGCDKAEDCNSLGGISRKQPRCLCETHTLSLTAITKPDVTANALTFLAKF